MKSFEEIMREKRQKRAEQTASDKNIEMSTTTESKQTAALSNSSTNVQKTNQASPKKYKFTPVVFDLDSKGSEKANSGHTAEQRKRKSLEVRVDSGTSTVQQRRRVSISKVAEPAAESLVTVTDVSATVQLSDPVKSDLTTEATHAVTESPSNPSELRTTPGLKRQPSTPSEVNKKRRTSSDSR